MGLLSSSVDHPLVIAEVAVEHLGSLNVAVRCVEEAAKAGCDYIKFQHHIPDQEMIPGEIRFWGGSLDEILDKYNFYIQDHKYLKQVCEKNNIEYLCTPFSRAAAIDLVGIGCRSVKIGSGEMDDWSILDYLADEQIEMLISTGMSTISEIDQVYDRLTAQGARFGFMNCTSEYPTAIANTRLLRLKELISRYNSTRVGQSDHSQGYLSSISAVALGARFIEKHFTLSRALRGPDWEVSLEPNELKELCSAVSDLWQSQNVAYQEISEVEYATRAWAKHGIYASKNIRAGELISYENIRCLRPAKSTSLRSSDLPLVLGKVVAAEIKEGDPVQMSDLI